MEKVRTRFAPSPTGYLHIGGLRTALYGYLYSKSHGGDFILRIEDTDTARYVDGSVQIIYDTMRDSGIMYDEAKRLDSKVAARLAGARGAGMGLDF